MKCASSRMNAGGLAALTLTALLVVGGECRADYLSGSWIAKDVSGSIAPPAYGLRLDGLFGGSAPVTFSFGNDVQFNALGNGSASLTGTITVNHNEGDLAGNGTSWLLDVQFSEVSDNGTLHFFEILNGSKMTLVGDPNTEVTFRNAIPDSVFQAGAGSASGSVDFQRLGTLFDNIASPETLVDGPGEGWWHQGTNEFAFELSSDDCQPVPAPGALSLSLLGAAGVAFYRRCRRSNGAE